MTKPTTKPADLKAGAQIYNIVQHCWACDLTVEEAINHCANSGHFVTPLSVRDQYNTHIAKFDAWCEETGMRDNPNKAEVLAMAEWCDNHADLHDWKLNDISAMLRAYAALLDKPAIDDAMVSRAVRAWRDELDSWVSIGGVLSREEIVQSALTAALAPPAKDGDM